MNGGLFAMIVILFAGGVLAGLVAVDVRRYQARERTAMEWCKQHEPRERDEHEKGLLP
jgi:hypothetical protein